MDVRRAGPEPGGVLEAARRPAPAEGRIFDAERSVRLGDVDRHGRLRLDALARHLQDVATDDTVDARMSGGALTWVVRRAAVVVDRWPRYLEPVRYSTFCSGTGPRWAERRTTGLGDAGGRVGTAVLWACIDAGTGRAADLPAGFDEVWGAATGGRAVSARLVHPPPREPLSERPWQVRAGDLDILGHVNNAVHWAAVEDELARLLPDAVPVAAELEYRLPIELDDAVTLRSRVDGPELRTWIVSPRGVHASARVVTG